jgi:thioesterase domain-containing protein
VPADPSVLTLRTVDDPSTATHPPLFAVHPSGGFAACYQDLARALDGLVVYAIQSPGVEQGPTGESWRVDSVVSLATRYIQAIDSVAPDGPLQLAGWSFGGTVAFEMARQLHERGRPVTQLTLFDLPPWGSGEPAHESGPAGEDEVTLLAELFCGIGADESRQLFPETNVRERVRALLRFAKVCAEPDEAYVDWALRVAALVQAHHQAAREYAPSTYPGRILLFQPSEGWDGSPLEQNLSPLQSVAGGGLQVCRMPGTHASMLVGDNALLAAERMCAEEGSMI